LTGASPWPLPLRAERAPWPRHPRYDGGGAGKGGTGTLSVNGSKVAEGRIEKTVPVVFSTDDTFDVGADWGTPVSPTYQTPFEFTGTLNQVTIEVT
jgi:hypothetical protein